MFSLRDSSCTSSSGTDEDSFGWWIGVEADSQETPESSLPTDSSACYTQATSRSSDDYATSSVGECYCNLMARPDDDDDDAIDEVPVVGDQELELRSVACSSTPLDEDMDGRESAPALCYTPERLVRSEDFRILAPSPRLCPALEEQGNENGGLRPGLRGSVEEEREKDTSHNRSMIAKAQPTTERSPIGGAAARLTSLLRSPRRGLGCRMTSGCGRSYSIGYGNGEVLLDTADCCQSYVRDDEDDGNKEEDERTGSSAVSLEQWTCSDYGSCYELRSRPMENDQCSQKEEDHQREDESAYISDEHQTEETNLATEEDGYSDDVLTEETRRLINDQRTQNDDALGRDCGVGENRQEETLDTSKIAGLTPADLGKDKLPMNHNASRSSADCLSRLALVIERNVGRPLIRGTDQDAEIQRLRGKVEMLQCSNKDLYGEISTLRRDFKREEWKMNDLSEKINKLRNEVYELRYLDDLLKLLQGELERISKRNWPFVIGHTKQGTEEINLVV